MKHFGSSVLPGETSRTRLELNLQRRLQSAPVSTISRLSQEESKTGVQKYNVLSTSTVPTETPRSGKSINGSSNGQDPGSSTNLTKQRPGSAWTNLEATPARTSSSPAPEAPQMPLSSGTDQLSETMLHLTTQVTVTRNSDNVGETERSSQALLDIAPDQSSTHVNSKEQSWRTLSVTTPRTSETSRKLWSTWNDQLSEITVPLTTQVAGTVQPTYVSETESFSRMFLSTAPDRASTHIDIIEQPVRTPSTTASRTFETPPAKPSRKLASFKPLTWTPSTQTPSTQTPSTQTPSTQTPSTQTPSTQTPSTQTPSTQTPSTQTPSTQTPSTQTPSTQTPSTQTPSTQTPSTQTPSTQTPSTQTPSTQTSSTQTQLSSWNDQLSDATIHPTAQATLIKQSSSVNTTDLPSHTFLAVAPDQSSNNAYSEVQSWHTSSVTALWNTDPPRQPTSLSDDQLVHITVQITIPSVSEHVDEIERSTHTLLTVASDRSSIHANSGEQPLPTRPGSTTVSWPSSSQHQRPEGALLDGHNSSFPALTSWR